MQTAQRDRPLNRCGSTTPATPAHSRIPVDGSAVWTTRAVGALRQPIHVHERLRLISTTRDLVAPGSCSPVAPSPRYPRTLRSGCDPAGRCRTRTHRADFDPAGPRSYPSCMIFIQNAGENAKMPVPTGGLGGGWVGSVAAKNPTLPTRKGPQLHAPRQLPRRLRIPEFPWTVQPFGRLVQSVRLDYRSMSTRGCG